MMERISKGLVIISLLMQTNFLVADIFRSEDPQGNISFSDKASDNASLVKPLVSHYRYRHTVAKVYDGDTIKLTNGDKIRLLGINTPEINSRYSQEEPGGEQAKKWLQDKLQQSQILIEYDNQQRDKYDRLLVHLFLPDGEHINKSIVEAGLAILSIIPPNLRYTDVLIKAEQEAQQNGLGIWSMSEYEPIPITLLSKQQHSGWQRFLATPKSINPARKYVYLTLSKHVDIRIAKDNVSLFPDLENYLGKKIEVRGWASRNKDHYSILIHHPSAIILR